MGFRQTTITYDKQARQYGSSGWTLEKKLKLALDSITSFTTCDSPDVLRWFSCGNARIPLRSCGHH